MLTRCCPPLSAAGATAGLTMAVVGYGPGRIAPAFGDDRRRGTRASAGSDGDYHPRTADGQPDRLGFWQALNTANCDIAVPAGQGVVEGNEVPYQPWALRAAEAMVPVTDRNKMVPLTNRN